MSLGHRSRRIDLIRGLSILLVLLHHSSLVYHLTDTPLGTLLGRDAVRAVVRNGNYGVTLFFTVSGFLITSNARRRWGSLADVGLRGFYGLRIARIMPCLLLLLGLVDLLALAGIPIFGSRTEQGGPVSPVLVNLAALTFWMNVLIARIGWVNYALGVLWSLSVEEVFYLAFPLICRLLRHDHLIAAFCAVIIAIGPFYRLAHQDDEAGFLYAYFASFDAIAIGCCAALLASRIRPRRVLEAAVIAGMAALYLWRSIGATNVWGVTLMALGAGLLLCGAGTSRPSHLAPLPLRRLGDATAWLGRLSYELYLFHLVVLGLMQSILPLPTVGGGARLLLLAAYLLLSALVASAVGRLFAEPLNRALRHHFAIDRSTSRSADAETSGRA